MFIQSTWGKPQTCHPRSSPSGRRPIQRAMIHPDNRSSSSLQPWARLLVAASLVLAVLLLVTAVLPLPAPASPSESAQAEASFAEEDEEEVEWEFEDDEEDDEEESD